MDGEAKVEVDAGMIIATLSGVFDEAAYRRVRDTIARRLRETGHSRVLMDLSDAVIDSSTMAVFSVAASNPDVIPKGVRYAVVCSPQTAPARAVRFGESVARNRGASLRTFGDRESAREWLAREAD